MSYKFQRLREKIRNAVTSGELSGKLPGERELARRFHVNAKTLSKALTDLAAEGVLHRSIGRGTFVKGSAPQEESVGVPWLLIVDPRDLDSDLIKQVQSIHPDCQVIHDVSAIRPSFLNQFGAVIDFSAKTPEPFIRDLIVRNIQFLAVGREPRTYSTNAVLMDTTLAASHLTRELALAGHRRFLAIEDRNQHSVSEAMRQCLARYAPGATVDSCFAEEIGLGLEGGATAAVCDSVRLASQALAQLAKAGIEVPGRISLAAIGCAGADAPCTGCYVPGKEMASAIMQILSNSQPNRPTALWLAGTKIDRGTTAGPQIFETSEDGDVPTMQLAPTS